MPASGRSGPAGLDALCPSSLHLSLICFSSSFFIFDLRKLSHPVSLQEQFHHVPDPRRHLISLKPLTTYIIQPEQAVDTISAIYIHAPCRKLRSILSSLRPGQHSLPKMQKPAGCRPLKVVAFWCDEFPERETINFPS